MAEKWVFGNSCGFNHKVRVTYVSSKSKGSGSYDVRTMKQKTSLFNASATFNDFLDYGEELSKGCKNNDWIIFKVDDKYVLSRLKVTIITTKAKGSKLYDTEKSSKKLSYFPINTSLKTINDYVCSVNCRNESSSYDWVLLSVENIYDSVEFD